MGYTGWPLAFSQNFSQEVTFHKNGRRTTSKIMKPLGQARMSRKERLKAERELRAQEKAKK